MPSAATHPMWSFQKVAISGNPSQVVIPEIWHQRQQSRVVIPKFVSLAAHHTRSFQKYANSGNPSQVD
eukprot:1597171-Amphidinium_carterae.1